MDIFHVIVQFMLRLCCLIAGHLKERLGTDVDKDNLYMLYSQLGYQICIQENLTGMVSITCIYTDWYRLVQTGTEMYRLVQPYADLYRDVQTFTGLYRLIQTCTNMYRLVQTFTDLYKHAQICRDLYKDIQTYEYFCKLMVVLYVRYLYLFSPAIFCYILQTLQLCKR